METATKIEKEFSYSTNLMKAELIAQIPIPLNISVQEFVGRLMNAHNLPCFIESDLKNKLEEFVEKETNNFYNSRSNTSLSSIRNGDVDCDYLASSWEEKFNQEVLEYATPEPVSNETVFSEVYHALIHSPALETLLNLEHTYAIAVGELIEQRDRDLDLLQQRQRLGMDEAIQNAGITYTDDQINQLAQRHFENTQMAESKWASELSNLQESQKREYREWVMKVHEDSQASEATPSYVQRVRQLSNPGTMDRQVSVQQRREESFTVHLGAQLKTTHNIRLVSANVLELCKHKSSQIGSTIIPQPQRLQTAMSLYSNSLCALVLLVDNRLNSYTGIKRDFAKVCEQSTDFHFPTLEQQFEKIELSVQEAMDDRLRQKLEDDADKASLKSSGSIGSLERDDKSLRMKPGDFYISRHSNLSEVHIVFHLVTDDSVRSSVSDISSRHAVILGYRNILKACFKYDIHTITLPLLLAHEMSEEMTIPWCLKRAELIFKCVKGFMMEIGTWGGQESRTVQFLVPRDLSEDTFSQINTMLPSIFRMSNPVIIKSAS